MALVSVVIPYHEAHAQLVLQAVASCLWQSFSDIHVIVVNDSKQPDWQFADARVRCVNSYALNRNEQKNRAAVARNYGTQFVDSDYVVYLDADDYLLPRGLEVLLRGHVTHDYAYTYSSHYNGKFHMRPPEYKQETYKSFNIHPITCLLPTHAVKHVRGFDEWAPGWEDWTLYLRLAMAGYCGYFHRGPIFVYRDEYSINHVQDVAGGSALMERVLLPYQDQLGAITMACCGSNDKQSARRVVSTFSPISADGDGLITLEYVGDMQGTATWRHPRSGRIYRAGRNPANRIIRVSSEDVEWLEQFKFRRVMSEQPHVPPPPPAEAIVISVQTDTVAEPVAEPVVEPVVERVMGPVGQYYKAIADEPVKVKRGRPKQS